MKRYSLRSEHGAADGTDRDIAAENGMDVAVLRSSGSIDRRACVQKGETSVGVVFTVIQFLIELNRRESAPIEDSLAVAERNSREVHVPEQGWNTPLLRM